MYRQYNFINVLDTNKYHNDFTRDDYDNSNIHNIFSARYTKYDEGFVHKNILHTYGSEFYMYFGI